MNLINEQSVTTSTSASSSSKAEKELSPAQVRFASYSCSSMTLVEVSSTISTLNVTQSTQPSVVVSSGAGLLPLSCSSSSSKRSSSLPTTSLAFSSRVCTSSSSSSSFLSSSPLSLSLPLPLSSLASLSSLSSLPSVESINRQIERISNTITSSDANQINLIKKMPTNTTTPPVLSGKSTAGKPSADSINTPTTTVTVTDVSETKPTATTAKALNEVPAVPSEKEREVGCEHYKRRAMFVTPCCNKFYKCRYCHDENETHHFDRKTLTELICNECNTRQQVQEQCENCGVRFGKYTCLICNLFDDEDKNQYHCDDCGICRIGGRENFFHCEVCNMCLPIELKIEGHRCVENISRSNCPVCLGAIHTSRIPCHIPECGHLLHKMCFDQLLASGHYVCPTCQTSLLDMTKMWEYLDAQALLMAVPKKYENQRVYIFCNDCHETCKTKFHFVGLKCIHCGGYNTTQDVKRRMSWVNSADSSTSA